MSGCGLVTYHPCDLRRNRGGVFNTSEIDVRDAIIAEEFLMDDSFALRKKIPNSMKKCGMPGSGRMTPRTRSDQQGTKILGIILILGVIVLISYRLNEG
jgi:hypothetical protein